MPEVRRGSSQGIIEPPLLSESESRGLRFSLQQRRSSGRTPTIERRGSDIEASREKPSEGEAVASGEAASPARPGVTSSGSRDDEGSNKHPRRPTHPGSKRVSFDPDHPDNARRSLSYALRPDAEAYYDSRAGSRREWKRRGKTLQEYYDDNSQLLPQLPFTWHHGRKRWRLFVFAFLVFADACAMPIALYYALKYAGHVQGWIIFAIITTIWGGPTYLEFAVRTLRLMKKERFYRPLGTNNRWCFDILHWTSVLIITAVTALFVIGSAPHFVWLRVLCMPAPAILWCLGGVLGLIQLYHCMGWRAPFRISSTPKGGQVLPGIYYFVEDVVAVNAGAGRPFREALAARYQASPRFRQMLHTQSWFWSIPSLILAAALTVVAVIPPIPPAISYGICWAVPFMWWGLWGIITVRWCKRDLVRERLEWEAGVEPANKLPTPSPRSEENSNV